MRIRSIRNSAILCALIAVSYSSAAAQQAKISPLPVQQSNVIDEIRSLITSRPKADLKDIVEAANVLLDKNGLRYELYFDAATCENIDKVRLASKDPKAPVKIGGTLKSVDGDAAALALPDARFAPGNCGCYMLIPLLQITTTDFVTLIAGRNIRFALPSNFKPNEAVLIDEKDRSIVKRRWRIPERLEPIGVSHDENVLYLAFNEPELKDLSLAVFGEGVFQIATRVEAEEGGKGEVLSGTGTAGAGPTLKYTRFVRWRKTFVIGSATACR